MAEQKSTSWVPTPKQAKLLDAAQEPKLNLSISAMCKAAGVDRKSYYKWMADPDFKTAWDSLWRSSISRQMPGVVAAQLKKALKGDTQAARLVADLAGVIKQKHDVSLNVSHEDALAELD